MKVYLDTTIINYLEAYDVPEKMADTKKFWSVLMDRKIFEVFTSTVTYQEIDDCKEPKRSLLLKYLANIDIKILQETLEISNLAKEYVENKVLSEKHFNDLLHIAHAVITGCPLIVSWNFKHFVNIKTIDRVNAYNIVNGLIPVKIVPPTMVIGGLDVQD